MSREKMPKTIETIVSTKLKDLRVPISPLSTGRELFYRIVAHIGLKEIWYFGLEYIDNRDNPGWLKLNRKILHHDIKRDGSVIRFNFRVKFFPEELSDELIQLVTQRLFFFEARDAILKDEVYCPTDKAVLLASLSCQAEYGEYSLLTITGKFLQKEKLLPDRILGQYNFSKDDWDQRISELWKRHGDMHSEDAIIAYLKIVQDLEMYGVNYFPIENKKGSNLWLGIDCFGLHIYEKENRLSPKVGFPWNEIKTLSYTDRRFIIKPIEKKSPDFVFSVSLVTTNKRILALSMGNHELYMRRRRPEPVEISQLKTEANNEKMQKRGERMTLQRERRERLKAQQINQQLQEKAKTYEQSAREAEQALQEARQSNLELERQRVTLERERRKISNELDKRDNENEYLRNKYVAVNTEMQEALSRRKAKEQAEKLKQAQQALQEQEEQKRRQERAEMVPETFQTLFNDNSPSGSPVPSPSQPRFRVPEPDEVDGSTSGYQDLPVMEALPEYDREENMENYLHSFLDHIKEDLPKELRRQNLTPLDHIYLGNVEAGINDKYKTWKRIRMGNTKQRVDQFECM